MEKYQREKEKKWVEDKLRCGSNEKKKKEEEEEDGGNGGDGGSGGSGGDSGSAHNSKRITLFRARPPPLVSSRLYPDPAIKAAKIRARQEKEEKERKQKRTTTWRQQLHAKKEGTRCTTTTTTSSLIGDMGYNNRLIRTIGWTHNISRSRLSIRRNSDHKRRPCRPSSATSSATTASQQHNRPGRRCRPSSATTFGRKYVISKEASERRKRGVATLQNYHADKKQQVQKYIANRRMLEESADGGWKEGWEEEEDEDEDEKEKEKEEEEEEEEDEDEDEKGEVTEEGMYEYFQDVRNEDVMMQSGFNIGVDLNNTLHHQMSKMRSTPGPAAYAYERVEAVQRGKRGVPFLATPRFEYIEREVKRLNYDSVPRPRTMKKQSLIPVSPIRSSRQEGRKNENDQLFNSARLRYVAVAKDQGERVPM